MYIMYKDILGLGPRALRVQVPNNQILTQNLYLNYNSLNPKYPIIGCMDRKGPAQPFDA